MILALIIYWCQSVGVLGAAPVTVNVLAAGSVVTEAAGYSAGKSK